MPERERGLLLGKITFASDVFKGLSTVTLGGKLFELVTTTMVNNAIKSFQQVRITIGRNHLLMRTQDMAHTLGRHHPSFWHGVERTTNTFFTSQMKVNYIRSIAISVLNQNQGKIRTLNNASGQFRGVVNGVTLCSCS
jgi:hypothetical protein